MRIVEYRDAGEARRYLLQGIWLQRVHGPNPECIRPVLEWALEILSAGNPLPPLGLIADIGSLAFGDPDLHVMQPELCDGRGFPAGLKRAYEDHFLGRLYADSSFERGAAALGSYQGRDRARGFAFLLNQIRERAGFGGVVLSPALVRSLLKETPTELLAEGWTSVFEFGQLPILKELYAEAIAAVRNVAAVLGPEDVFELEHRTALAEFGQRIALRQVLQAADLLEATAPSFPPRGLNERREVHSVLPDDDIYPVGGFSSISTRGSIESLLHSQLAFMETGEGPDLFDIKFVRDELLYYARDESEALRRRRTFVVALMPDLDHCRVKDAELLFQRIILCLALLLVTVRKLTAWLNQEAVVFEFLFVNPSPKAPLAAERKLLETLLRDQLEAGMIRIRQIVLSELEPICTEASRRSLCHCLIVGETGKGFEQSGGKGVVFSQLSLGSPSPVLEGGNSRFAGSEAEGLWGAWHKTLEALLINWL